MLSAISLVSWLRVSAWLGITFEAAGRSSTSSKVSPKGMSLTLMALLRERRESVQAIR